MINIAQVGGYSRLLVQGVCGLVLSALTPALYGEAQVKNFPELSLQNLATQVDSLYGLQPAAAIPYMLEIKTRLTNAMSEEYRGIYRENLYRLGLAHIRWYEHSGKKESLLEGIPYWDEFIAEFLSDNRHPLAVLNRADSLFATEQWGASLDAYRYIIRVYQALVKEEDLLGLLQRMVHAARESERITEVNETLWDFLRGSDSYALRLFCLNTLFDQSLKDDNITELLKLVVVINSDRDFLYDIGVNLRLLHTGDKFEDEERYLEAGLLFSMVLPVERLLVDVEDRLMELEEWTFRNRSSNETSKEQLAELEALREQRLELVAAPKYTANLRWRQARVLQLMGREYEAYFAFLRLVDTYPQHRRMEQFRYATFTQGIKCDYLHEAMEHGEDYLSEPAYLLFEKPVAVQLAGLYAHFEAIEKLSLLADSFLHRFPYEPVASQMSHYLGQALFKKGMVERIIEDFPLWSAEYPEGAFIDSVSYWLGMAYLFGGDFEAALQAFDTLLANHPGSVYYKEASFRRGVAYFGLGQYAEAREVFESWLPDSPGHPLIPEAHVFLGDLDAMDARVENALTHYRLVEEAGGALALIEHAYFESASLLLANQRYSEHDRILEQFLDKYPNSTSCAEAVLRMAEASLDRGLLPEAFTRYRDGIERFGNDEKSDAVDSVIDSWWEQDAAIRARATQTAAFIAALLEDEEFRAQMLDDRIAQIQYFQAHTAIDPKLKELLTIRHPLYAELTAQTDTSLAPDPKRVLRIEDYPALGALLARNEERLAKLPSKKPSQVFEAMHAAAVVRNEDTLALRLLRVLNQRAGMTVLVEQIKEEWVEAASPATRVWIARLLAPEDAERAISILRELVAEAPESAAAAEGLFLLGTIESGREDHEAAQAYHNRVLKEHFSSAYAKSSAILRADALRQAQRPQEALEAYALVLSQREWRGEIWAEATFKMGNCFAEMDDPAKAQGFYERTYLAFSAYPDWSGRAILSSADLLEEMGDSDSAQRTYQYFLDLPGAQNSPYYDAIRQKRQTP